MNKIALFFLKNYIVSPRKEWLKFSSVFAQIGIIISIAVLTASFAIFKGYEHNLKKVILGANSHIYIFNNQSVSQLELERFSNLAKTDNRIDCFAPIVITPAIGIGKNTHKSLVMRGINVNANTHPIDYSKYIKGGININSDSEIIMGGILAKELGCSVGDTIKISSPVNTKFSVMGLVTPYKYFKVVGMYNSGMFDYDSKFIICTYNAARFFSSGNIKYSSIEVKLKPEFIEEADKIAFGWEMKLGGDFNIMSWQYFNYNLFSLIKLEKWVLFIILSFMVLVASFNVVSSIATDLIQKRTEIGILKTLGVSSKLIKQIFLFKTVFQSIAGIIIGQIVGFLLAFVIVKQNIYKISGEVYFLNDIHMKFDFYSFILILGVGTAIVMLTSLLPLNKIYKMNISDIIRNI